MKNIYKKLIAQSMTALAGLVTSLNIPKIERITRKDVGRADMTIDSEGNVTRVITRPANYDLVTITERDSSGKMYSRSFVPERYKVDK